MDGRRRRAVSMDHPIRFSEQRVYSVNSDEREQTEEGKHFSLMMISAVKLTVSCKVNLRRWYK